MTGGKPKLKKSFRAAIDAGREEAALFGGEVHYDFAYNKHPKVTLVIGDRSWVIPFASTPKVDHNASWMRQRVRQKAREIASEATPPIAASGMEKL
jgi:hypothetical protein